MLSSLEIGLFIPRPERASRLFCTLFPECNYFYFLTAEFTFAFNLSLFAYAYVLMPIFRSVCKSAYVHVHKLRSYDVDTALECNKLTAHI
jgi:hypothetical protein